MRHRTMAEYALEQLREAIILGELPAGTPLRLDELARSLGMSISPIRRSGSMRIVGRWRAWPRSSRPALSA